MRKTGYKVTVVEINEIAGEMVKCDAVAFTCKTLYEAKEWIRNVYGVKCPFGTKIVDIKTGTEYDVYGI